MIACLAGFVFFGILFLQSGFNKVSDFNGNYHWLKEHFASSPFSSYVKPILLFLTVLECVSAILSILSAILIFSQLPSSVLIKLTQVFLAVTFLSLFTGQRVAKDYPGAASIAIYFTLLLVHTYITGEYFRQ